MTSSFRTMIRHTIQHLVQYFSHESECDMTWLSVLWDVSMLSIHQLLPFAWWYEMVAEILHTAPFHSTHDDVIKWTHFPRYWSFVRGIHQSPVNSPHKGQWRGALMFYLNKRLSKQSWGWWLETPSHPLWRHCNAVIMSIHMDGNLHTPDWLPFQQMALVWERDNIAQIPQNYLWA